MTGRQLITAFCMCCVMSATAQQKQAPLKQGLWNASLLRNDGKQIPFVIDLQYEQQELCAYIVNGQERIRTEKISFRGDSAIMRMPVFESYFRIRKVGQDSLNGVWVKGAANKDVILPFSARLSKNRSAIAAKAIGNIQGKWDIEITRPNQTKRPAIGSFTQDGNKIAGSILTPSADYRYLTGIISGDSILFSTFDGSHAMLFLARIDGDKMTGTFYNGASGKENWEATRNENAALPEPASPVTAVKQAGEQLNFSFRNIDGETISINDERYKGKVVIVQIMGSWCPNCMDETAFLSDYYRKNKDRGLEIIALAYELSTDENRSAKSLRKFQQQFNVPYQMLITGVTASDPEKAEKSLPQLTAIKSFPTTVFVNRQGKISAIKTDFYGPAAKEYHEQFKRDFDATMNKLLSE